MYREGDETGIKTQGWLKKVVTCVNTNEVSI